MSSDSKLLKAAIAVCFVISAGALALSYLAWQGAAKSESVRDYLVRNPEVLIEAQAALEEKQSARRVAEAGQTVRDNHAAIFAAAGDIVLGNPQGDVTVVEFFDYNCGYCRRALTDMEALLEKDDRIRFVLKEFPILGPDSLAAHRVSHAVGLVAPQDYAAFHRAILGSQEPATGESALAVAVGLGIDEAALRQSMAERPNDESVRQTYELATKLGLTGTPSYIVGDEPVFGAVGAAAIAEKVANIRNCGKTSCPPSG